MASKQRSARARTLALSLASSLIVALAFQAHASAEKVLILDVDVVDTTPEDEPPCLGMDSPPAWSPEWWDSDTMLDYEYDVFDGGGISEPITLWWSDGRDEDCNALSPAGTVASSIGLSDPKWTGTVDCSAPACDAGETNTITVDLTPPGDVSAGDSVKATVTLTWIPE